MSSFHLSHVCVFDVRKSNTFKKVVQKVMKAVFAPRDKCMIAYLHAVLAGVG